MPKDYFLWQGRIKMSDTVLRATAGGDSVRIFVANTSNTVNEAFKRHRTSPVVSAALGRTITATAIMGTMLKNDSDIVTATVKGDGPIGSMTVTADAKGNVKGYAANAWVDLPLRENGKLAVSDAVGCGTLTVIKDLGLKEPYVGQINLISGEIAEDFTYYFAQSEQTPSAVALGVLVDRDYSIKCAGGFILQIMPEADEAIISALEAKIASITSVTAMFEKGMTNAQILNEIAGDFSPKILDEIPIRFYCNCSKERVEKALIAVGREELEDILQKEGQADLHCHFCNTDYHFDREDLLRLLGN